MNWNNIDLSIEGLKAHYLDEDFSPQELLNYLLDRSEHYKNKNIWIRRLTLEEIEPYITALNGHTPTSLPLYGVPFAIKDNIDLAGIDTTAGCNAFTYIPDQHAFVVKQLIAAGAIPLGKTNMDQFATGLVGTRSPAPWGPCKNAFDDHAIAGGSSSGSAVAVALGLASFALGTDTAGSGRVPAAFNRLVGLKPTKGLLSTSGVVPACQSLDVVSIFTQSARDAKSIFDVAAQFDSSDPFARKNSFLNGRRTCGVGTGKIVLGIPKESQLEFFGDTSTQAQYVQCIEDWQAMGADIKEVDFAPFLQAAQLLYEGPWVTERYIATKSLIEDQPEALHPTVKSIIANGKHYSAEDSFRAHYTLNKLKRRTDSILQGLDFLITPTVATSYTIAQVLQDPVALNSNLGYYTNYMNLLDYSAIALPYTDDKRSPNGFSLVGKAFDDQKLLAWGTAWENHDRHSLGSAADTPRQRRPDNFAKVPFVDGNDIEIVVCGAHLRGQLLNWQLTERGAVFIKKTQSSRNYRLYALADGKRPGMIRDETKGQAIDVEVWRIPQENLGSFVANIPAPLSIGKIELADSSWKCGFICENYGLKDATEITHLGGWLAFLEQN